jgi:NAD(P)-dependent dehydrogenase (short-subunit alcohol dehydrogenase family)
LAQRLLDRGSNVIGVSRSEGTAGGPAGADIAPTSGSFHHISCDLGDIEALETNVVAPALRMVGGSPPGRITLVNNAGMVAPFGTLEQLEGGAAAQHIAFNLGVPLALSAAFLRGTDGTPHGRRILNISSGAARTAYPGWAPYSSAKAGLNMLTRVIAEENAYRDPPVRVLAVTPGAVETAMQKEIRSVSPDSFPMQEKFLRRKREGLLRSPEEAAELILRALDDSSIADGSTVDVRKQYPEAGG